MGIREQDPRRKNQTDLDDTMVFDRKQFTEQEPTVHAPRHANAYGGYTPYDDTMYYGEDEYSNPDSYDGYGDYDGYGYEDYDDGYTDYPQRHDRGEYSGSRRSQPTMAARAAGKANPDLYSRERSNGSARQAYQQARRQTHPEEERSEAYYENYPPVTRKRRKKHHGFRNFILFLLFLAAIAAVGYFMMFRAPAQQEDGIHTRRSGVYNILLCATDEGGMRTDTIMMMTLDRSRGASLTTIPRDTIVDSGDWVPKLNAVFADEGGGRDGAEALMDHVETLLGFRPDGYIVIDYEVFRDAVNAMGGVTFEVPMDMDTGDYTFSAGEQVLNGDEALAVCRFRYGYLMADIQRQYVQQTFVKAMIRQAVSPRKWPRLPAVYAAVMDNLLTDLSGANLRYLALRVMLSGLGDIEQNTLPGEGVDYNGSSCFGLYGQSVVDLVNEVMNPYKEEITIDDVYILTVEDGELVESTWRGTPFDPSTYDYDSYD